MALTVGFSYLLSKFVADVFGGSKPAFGLLWGVLAVGLGRAGLIWLQEWLASMAAARAKVQLRERLMAAVTKLGSEAMGGRNTSEFTLLATTRLDALDAYFSRFLPQLVYTAIITPVLTLLIFVNDFWSGVAVACTLPLIPLFMVFIGWSTGAAQRRQINALNLLWRHFGEVLRGLTTLRVFGRLPHQSEALRASSDESHKRTMKVLRISFLSGFALEVAASLSVALVAVSIGLRLIDGTLSLETGLFVLLLAPEAYLPLRLVGTNFHASNEGVMASKQVLDLIESADTPDWGVEAFLDTDELREGTVTHLVGPSGSGKTQHLNVLRDQLGAEQVSWLPQYVGLIRGTVLDNIIGPGNAADEHALAQAMELAALDDVALKTLVGDSAAGLSGGQSQRVGLARAFYRCLTLKTKWLMLDEPLSAFDSARAETIVESAAWFAAQGHGVLVVSHQPFASATRTLEVSDFA